MGRTARSGLISASNLIETLEFLVAVVALQEPGTGVKLTNYTTFQHSPQTCTLVHKQYTAQEVTLPTTPPFSYTMVSVLPLKRSGPPVHILNIYCPPKRKSVTFGEIFTMDPLLIVGDFNAPSRLWGSGRTRMSGRNTWRLFRALTDPPQTRLETQRHLHRAMHNFTGTTTELAHTLMDRYLCTTKAPRMAVYSRVVACSLRSVNIPFFPGNAFETLLFDRPVYSTPPPTLLDNFSTEFDLQLGTDRHRKASIAAVLAISLTAAAALQCTRTVAAFTAMNGKQSPAGSARLPVPVPLNLSLSSAPEPSPAALPPAAELHACRQQQFLLNRNIGCDAMEPTNARIADQPPNSAMQPTQVRMDTTTPVQTNNLSGPASNTPELTAAQMMDITAPPLTSTQSSIQPTAFESTDTHATHGTVVSRFYSPNPFDVLNPSNNHIGDSNCAPTITPHFQAVWSSRAVEADNRPWQQQRKRTKIQASSLNTPPQPVTRTRQTVLLRPAERFAVSEIPHGALQDGAMAIGGPQTQDYRIRIQPEANLIAIDAWNPSLIPRFLGLTTIQGGVRNFAFRPYEATPPDHARGIFHGFDVKDDGPTLLAQIACRTHKPVAARPLDSQGRSVLVTFAGPTLPRFITYRLHHKQITPFRPKATVCTRCHLLGHTHDVCPTETPCCSTCGRPPHRVEIDGCHEPPICRNCQGPHIATDNLLPIKETAHEAASLPTQGASATRSPQPKVMAPMPEPYRAALAALEERLNRRLQDELIRLTTQFTQTVENVFARMMSTISPLLNVVAQHGFTT
ncbi:hypothetical protein HPB49_022556 [Dermacentor silvarum]|uniref:Uncharacterized protein n=1 Tax=Dermacentor silvarum TaxID=543639 RepID=A0ACB8CN14_DERSI|nr:hypothetical protein HPB49_022556 [Dermacentor silvarum]